MKSSLNIFLVLSSIALCVCAEAISSIELNRDNFESEIKGKNYLVIFYSQSCELGKRLFTKFDKLAENINNRDDVKLAYVDCNADSEFCDSNGVKGLAVFFYPEGKERIQFSGVKSEEGLSRFLIKNLGDSILENLLEVPEKLDALNDLTDETFADHVAVGNHFVKFYAPWCGHCQRLEPIWNELANSLEYDPSVSISRIDCTQYRSICQDFEVKGYPTLLWIVDGKKVEKYSGSRAVQDFKAFIEAKTATEKKDSDEHDAKVEEIAVLQLTGGSFNHGVEKGVTIVKFFAPWCGHCKRMAPTWDELAVKFAGSTVAKVAKVDCTLEESKDLCNEQGVDGFPTIFLYKNGEKVEEYNGNRMLDDLFEFVSKHAQSHDEL
ncbi:thioredoxin domain-containing protein 5 [Sitodiplosis mosellana]|uniref:thioredoxin domain-containing protein 5 n=1 Tax=Sitodiplosis mosellana TaxID=263140 RepID=UPI002443ED0D|nr:thioredoxin domain-containing protein 5 [Sitodiplosis mosellana]